MYGAILGDIIGEPYEGTSEKDILLRGNGRPLFKDKARVTDDSVMTVAVGEALLSISDDTVKRAFSKRVSKKKDNPYEEEIRHQCGNIITSTLQRDMAETSFNGVYRRTEALS